MTIFGIIMTAVIVCVVVAGVRDFMREGRRMKALNRLKVRGDELTQRGDRLKERELAGENVNSERRALIVELEMLGAEIDKI